ncbi:LLM class flavin-dependent oxidoreductase [Williamsia maris]|uniref:Flavin-dependent oxidoreductase, luciferase family (Includes alkanesulfonate monooxygenase SsuD and methylene tetrahydromethanopterin reductase) n=1 Tax=Williamsia maris TaxID=72806 RepID=A0ABT1HIZ7_9NOCA|nr:LLM class flavin-dependent oxidoreductase [Williamsia maris]MCP2177896.1 Flavin-dependent oxidoreductase, luciferase family (includes alkanesulfonate monooxygenase SsuD and methylene tetrahydromethanopterin reductase) [Williamsia maris]
MPRRGEPLTKLGFLTIGRFDEASPRAGHLETIEVIQRAEDLGFDSVWLRDRHLQFGISSPVAVMAAAAMKTSRIELGTAVIPLGLENPFRLAEDLATVDLLSDGRVNPGVSVGTPMRYDDYKTALYPDTHDVEDFSKERVVRLLSCLRGDPVSPFEGTVGIENFSRRVQPHSPGLVDRVWYGGGLSSAIWAGQQQLNYLTSSVVTTEGSDSVDFATIQGEQIDAYLANHPDPSRARVSQGLVVIPTDTATPDQVRRYQDYAESRFERTLTPQGPRKMLFAPDLVGPSDELAEKLYAHAGFQRASEVAFALPFSFEPDDYIQIISDMATHLGPALGWTP